LERLYQADCDPKLLSPLTLAFVGDGVFELFVRERLVCQGNCPVNSLHKQSVAQVCCSAQAKASQKLLPFLTEDETEVFKRGRNAHTNHVPKNSSTADYHAATAFEALFGYVYLTGKIDRLRELFNMMCNQDELI
jgi:ribonuclease III family protein